MLDKYIYLDKAQHQDISVMKKLWHLVPGVGIGRGDDPASLVTFMDRNPDTCLILKKRNAVIGTVLGGFDGRRGYIYHLAIHPDQQGKGYGKMLVHKVVEELKRMGAHKIHLFAFKDNHPALIFYEGLGWQRRQDIEVMSYDTSLIIDETNCC